MPGPLVSFLAPVVLVGFQNHTEARLRGDDTSVNVDAIDVPSLSLSVMGRRTRLRLGYGPVLTYYAVGTPEAEWTLYHGFDASVQYTYRRGFAALQQTVSFGRQNLRVDLAPEPTTLDPDDPQNRVGGAGQLPDDAANQQRVFDEIVLLGSSETTVGFGQYLSRRLTLNEFVGYTIRTGLDDRARELYPAYHQQLAGFGLGYQASARDTWSTGLYVQRASVSGRADSYVSTARVAWDRALSKSLRGRATGGVSYALEYPEGEDSIGTFAPVGEVSVVHGWVADSSQRALTGTVGVATTVDSFTGRADSRAYGSLSLSESREHGLTTFVAVSGVSSLETDQEQSLTLLAVSAGASYPLSRELFLGTIATTSWQVLQIQEISPTVWTASATLTYRPSALQL